MRIYRYSEWDGSEEQACPDADELIAEIGDNLMSYGDLPYALRMMQQGGMKDRQGRRLPGIQQLLQQLRQTRQGNLEKYNLNSSIDDIRKKLDDILKKERDSLQAKLEDQAEGESDSSGLSPEIKQRLRKNLLERASQSLKKLNDLPHDLGGKLQELQSYDFMDEQAGREFQELMNTLKQHAMESYSRDLIQKLKDMSSSSMAGIRHFVEAVNQMLEQRLRGEQPDFEQFMEQFGDYFGQDRPQSLEQLAERFQEQIAQAQSLLESMSPRDREELENLLRSMLDESTQYELAKMAINLEALYPGNKLRKQYSFTGDEPLSYSEALKLMEMMQKMDKLETELKDSQYNRSLDAIDEKLVKELIGDEALRELKALRSITKVLEDAGYIRIKDGKYELTPRGMRKIGQKALVDIFAQLSRDRAGGHNLNTKGGGGERIEETKAFSFGDDFNLHLQRTIMNAIYRETGEQLPVRLRPDDFEVYKTEGITRSATVLMLDLSLSMPMRGNFQAAKRVAIALDGLIRNQYPKDSLHIVGFSSYARQIKKEDLSYMSWDEFDPYTNIQHGLYLARKMLTAERCANRQIIMISDGEPTAHFEGGNIFFQYPPSLRTLQLTLREVRNCTQQGIVINAFMLESDRFFSTFANQMAHINKGRIFYTNAENLGQYLLVDYVAHKKRKI